MEPTDPYIRARTFPLSHPPPRVAPTTGTRSLVGPAPPAQNGTPVHVSRHSPPVRLTAPGRARERPSKRPGVSSDRSLPLPPPDARPHVSRSPLAMYGARVARRVVFMPSSPLRGLEEGELVLQLPPGFRFHPTDEELVMQYLCRRCAGLPIAMGIITEVDLYKYDPWQLPRMALHGEKEWYFFSPRDRKYPNGSRPNRAAGTGYWKATGADKPVGTPKPLAIKKALVFYAGKAPKGVKTNWIMHEYRLADVDRSARKKNSVRLDDWVLCRIYNKKGGPEKPSGGDRIMPAVAKAGHGQTAVGSPPEQKPAVLLPPYAPPLFSELAAYYDVRPSDSMPRAHADSSCSEHVLTASCGRERPEVQSQPKIAEWERTFATADPGVKPAASLLGQIDPAAGLAADDPLLQDILMYWGKPF